jgi:hypothetical protein
MRRAWPAGAYYVRIETPTDNLTKRVVLVR